MTSNGPHARVCVNTRLVNTAKQVVPAAVKIAEENCFTRLCCRLEPPVSVESS